MIYMHDIESNRVAQVYDKILDTLVRSGLDRAESVSGLLAALAVQFRGQPLAPVELQMFTRDASLWLSAYFDESTGSSTRAS